jgi:hypothetical protein
MIPAALRRVLRRNESITFRAQFKATTNLHQANAAP